jgi:hypothetical protein
VLLLYEGDAACQADAKVRVRMVDFAHTFFQQQEGGAGSIGPGGGAGSPCCGNGSSGAGSEAQVAAAGASRDDNFHAGLRALLARLRSVVHAQLEQDLTV